MSLKFRKSLSALYVLFPIVMLSIAIPSFYLNFVAQDANNTKKILQEAAYTGALAASSTLDVKNFQEGLEKNSSGAIIGDIKNGTYIMGQTNSGSKYPIDKQTGSPIVFLKQKNKYVRYGSFILKGQPGQSQDCVGNNSAKSYVANSTEDMAATEGIKAVQQYLENALCFKSDGSNKPVYTANDYSVSVSFERTDIKTDGPYNKVNFTVALKYKPILYANLFKDSNGNSEIPIYGVSSAISKTIN